MSVCACVCVHIHVCAHACEGQRSRPGIFIFVTGSLTGPEGQWFGWTRWPESPRDPPVSISPALGLQVCATMPGFLQVCWGPKLRSSCFYGRHFTRWAISLAPCFCLDMVFSSSQNHNSIVSQLISIWDCAVFLLRSLTLSPLFCPISFPRLFFLWRHWKDIAHIAINILETSSLILLTILSIT